MKIGILAFHGDVAEHAAVLRKLGFEPVFVRTIKDLDDVTHLILPGGESTVIAKFLTSTGLREKLIERASSGSLSIFGTCAGAILLAKEAKGKNAPESLGLINISIDRNAYGTQAQSFQVTLNVKGIDGDLEAAFIRAPIIQYVGSNVQVLASHDGHPVIVQSEKILAATCHPELCEETALHKYFLGL
jgi:5'-phosphate synthase pdxT subunit